jgi:hypothetical protein
MAAVATQVGLPANFAAGAESCAGLPNGDKEGACWEGLIEDDHSQIDLRENFVVESVQNFIKDNIEKTIIDALQGLAETGGSPLLESFKAYFNGTELPDGRGLCYNFVNGLPSYCIDFDGNLTAIGVPVFKNDTYIPGLEVARTFIFQCSIRMESLDMFALPNHYVSVSFSFGIGSV